MIRERLHWNQGQTPAARHSSKLGDKIARAQKRLERAKDQFSDELNKSLNDESRLDELLDAVIMAEQDVMVSWVFQHTFSAFSASSTRRTKTNNQQLLQGTDYIESKVDN